ncbi:glycosyltransferase family 1 protein [Nodosilinea sp. LEGE 07088]|uniref:CgeB family protein n=1 Tax=Nodosilinea sp. LEGE 07088 TaxID=2777968 RepID=UPI001881971B|nr:glycosyltransferase [Nodosilinea sp. LEGE 07088]MBE9139441.1 glycosyltransferase family 1 protein [Nodosilinea sp. LEGE 07088]
MKLFKIAIPFWQHWLQLYGEHPELATQSWAEQQATINRNWFGYPHAWKDALEPLGYKVVEVLANVELVQKTWAAERSFAYDETTWKHDILKGQILEFQPEILFVADMFQFAPEWIQSVRQSCPSIRVVMGWCGGPWPNDALFKAYDFTLSCVPEIVEILNGWGHRTFHLNHSFDPRILERLEMGRSPAIDFSFIGNINRNSQFHVARDATLERLVSEIDVEIFTLAFYTNDSLPTNARRIAKAQLFRLRQRLMAAGLPTDWLDRLPLLKTVAQLEHPPRRAVNPRLKPFMQPPRFGMPMFQTLRDSRATFNSHIDLSANSASNMRLFEATGVGTCLVTDHKVNLNQLFESDREVLTYRSPDECLEKVKWVLAHPKQRDDIAQAGQARTLKEHTLATRAQQLDEILQREMQRSTVLV